MLYPNGSSCVRGKSLSLFLMLADANLATLSANARKLYAKYKLRIHDQLSNDHFEKQGYPLPITQLIMSSVLSKIIV